MMGYAKSNGTSSPPRKKARKGKKKSKAERLSRGLTINLTTTATSNANDNHDNDATVSLATLRGLLTSPEATTSVHWDRAQAVAMRLATTDARQLMVRWLVFDREAHKAAVHYARRLHLSQNELVAVLREGRDDASQCLAVARFLADADVRLVDNATRVTEFIVPWLDAHKATSGGGTIVAPSTTTTTTIPDDVVADTDAASTRTLPSAFATAVRLVLQVNSTHKKPTIVAEKLALQRLLVATLLADDAARDGHAGFLLQYASSLAPLLADAASIKETDSDTDERRSDDTNPAVAERDRRATVARHVETVLQMLWPDARVVLFGSSATSLLLSTEGQDGLVSYDDVDLCALLPSCPQFLDATAPLVDDIKDHVALYVHDNHGNHGNHDSVVAVTRARVPIVKWTDPATHLQCDLCVNNLAALWNTQLTRQLLRIPTVRVLSLWIKRWYRTHRFSTHHGGFAAAISSYGMQLLVFHYLQQCGVLPSRIDCGPLTLDAAALQTPDLVANIRDRVAQALASASTPQGAASSPSHWSLVVGFFAFYGANGFDFEHNVVSLRGLAMTKAEKQWTRRTWRFSLSMEDPIETDRDLGALFSRISLTRFRTALVAACTTIADAHVAGETATRDGRDRVLAALLADPKEETERTASPSK